MGKKQSFLRGAVILASANTVSRVLGLVSIIALPRIIRDDGMGILQMVRPIYYFGVVLAVSGLPVAISKLVAEKDARHDVLGVLRVFRLATGIMISLGVLCSAFLFLGAPLLSRSIFKDPGAIMALQAIAPSVLLLTLAAAWRGLFQGLQTMTPPAVSQIVEQVVRVGATVGLALFLMPRGVEYGAAGAAFGSVLGAFAGCIVLAGYYLPLRAELLQSKPRAVAQESYRSVGQQLIQLSFPIVLGAILWPVMQMLDTAIVPARLQAAGLDAARVRDLYGYYGMALSLMYFPNVLTWALSVSLVPAVSEAIAKKTRRLVRYRVQEAIRVTVLFSLPAGVGLYLLSDQISALLFGYSQVGEPLRILAVGSIFVGLCQTATGVLQGLGKVQIPMRNLAIGVVVKLILNYTLTAMPELGVNGAAWGTTIGFAVATLLNLLAIYREVGIDLDADLLLKPAVASALMAAAVPAVYRITRGVSLMMLNGRVSHLSALSNGLGVTGAVFSGALLYLTMLLFTGALAKKQVEVLPKVGPGLARWLHAKGLVH